MKKRNVKKTFKKRSPVAKAMVQNMGYHERTEPTKKPYNRQKEKQIEHPT